MKKVHLGIYMSAECVLAAMLACGTQGGGGGGGRNNPEGWECMHAAQMFVVAQLQECKKHMACCALRFSLWRQLSGTKSLVLGKQPEGGKGW